MASYHRPSFPSATALIRGALALTARAPICLVSTRPVPPRQASSEKLQSVRLGHASGTDQHQPFPSVRFLDCEPQVWSNSEDRSGSIRDKLPSVSVRPIPLKNSLFVRRIRLPWI